MIRRVPLWGGAVATPTQRPSRSRRRKWNEWSFKARSVFGLLDVGHGAVNLNVDEAEKMKAFGGPACNRDAQAASRYFYNIFAKVCGGEEVINIRQDPRGNGLERCRRLVRERIRAQERGMRPCLGASWRREWRDPACAGR